MAAEPTSVSYLSFQKLLQLLHGFLDFIKTAAAGIFILIAEILEFLLKET